MQRAKIEVFFAAEFSQKTLKKKPDLPAHPDGNLVSLAPDVDDRTVDELSVVLSKSFPDQQEEHFHPEVVQVKTPHVSIQTDQPPSDTKNNPN